MKRFITATILILLLFCTASFAAGPSGQVSCANTATLLYAPQGYFVKTLLFQNLPASTVNVLIAPRPDITASNPGIVLVPGAGIVLDGNSVTWYCITASSTATTGYTEAQ